MTVTLKRARTARHEAGHCAALLMKGRLPLKATADWPTSTAFGFVQPDWGEGIDPAGARDLAVAIILGPLASPEMEKPWPPEWRPDPDATGDAGQLGRCVRWLKLDEGDYYEIVNEAHTLARSPEFNELVDLLARALELKDELSADDLRWLIGEDRLKRYGIGEADEVQAS